MTTKMEAGSSQYYIWSYLST